MVINHLLNGMILQVGMNMKIACSPFPDDDQGHTCFFSEHLPRGWAALVPGSCRCDFRCTTMVEPFFGPAKSKENKDMRCLMNGASPKKRCMLLIILKVLDPYFLLLFF